MRVISHIMLKNRQNAVRNVKNKVFFDAFIPLFKEFFDAFCQTFQRGFLKSGFSTVSTAGMSGAQVGNCPADHNWHAFGLQRFWLSPTSYEQQVEYFGAVYVKMCA